MIEFIAESEAGRQLKMWPIRVKSYETQRHEARLSPFSWLQYHTALNFDREHPSLSLPPSSVVVDFTAYFRTMSCSIKSTYRATIPNERCVSVHERETSAKFSISSIPRISHVFVFEPLCRVDENFLRRN